MWAKSQQCAYCLVKDAVSCGHNLGAGYLLCSESSGYKSKLLCALAFPIIECSWANLSVPQDAIWHWNFTHFNMFRSSLASRLMWSTVWKDAVRHLIATAFDNSLQTFDKYCQAALAHSGATVPMQKGVHCEITPKLPNANLNFELSAKRRRHSQFIASYARRSFVASSACTHLWSNLDNAHAQLYSSKLPAIQL